jgi:hypothetical protein
VDVENLKTLTQTLLLFHVICSQKEQHCLNHRSHLGYMNTKLGFNSNLQVKSTLPALTIEWTDPDNRRATCIDLLALIIADFRKSLISEVGDQLVNLKRNSF